MSEEPQKRFNRLR